MGRHKKIVEPPIRQDTYVKMSPLDIVLQSIDEVEKEYKYTEDPWEEGAKVTTLRYLNDIARRLKEL